MNQFEEIAMNALKERDMAVRAIVEFLQVLDANKFTQALVNDQGEPWKVDTVELLHLTPPLQASCIHQLRMVAKTLKAKGSAS